MKINNNSRKSLIISFLEEEINDSYKNRDYEKYEKLLLEYIILNPNTIFYKLIYIDILLSRKEYESASILVNEINFRERIDSNQLNKYYRLMISCAIGLEMYDLAYELLVKNKNLLKNGKYEYDEILMYVKKALDIKCIISPFAKYDMKQLDEYSYEAFITQTVELNNKRINMIKTNDIKRDIDTAIFNTDVLSISKLSKRIRHCVNNAQYAEYARLINTIYDEYYFKYENACSYNGENTDYIRALTFKATGELVNIQPAKDSEGKPYIELHHK